MGSGPHRDGGSTNPATARRLFDRLVLDAGVPRITVDGTRHTWVTLVLLEGISAKVVAEVLGRNSTQVTLDVSRHVTPGPADRFASSTPCLHPLVVERSSMFRRVVAVLVATVAAALVVSVPAGAAVEGPARAMVGTWKLTGLSIDEGAVVPCPGTPATDPVIAGFFNCEAGNGLLLQANTTYRERLSILGSPIDTGHWFVGRSGDRSIIVFDDDSPDTAPRAYLYRRAGKTLTVTLPITSRRGVPNSPKNDYVMHFEKVTGRDAAVIF